MAIPRPEYPRPQFVRPDWLNLNGEWEFEIDQADSGFERGLVERPLQTKITVPFCPESELSGVYDRDFLNAVWYRREVTIPAAWTEIHHVDPAENDGPTETDNGVLLCWFHHRTIETSGWQIKMIGGVPHIKAPPWIHSDNEWRPSTKSPTMQLDNVEQRAWRT